MRALSLTQPWASLVALGLKRIETRSWSTKYRGELAIHAAKGFPNYAKELAEYEISLGRLPPPIPRGAVIAIVRLVDVRHTELVAPEIGPLERSYGDYTPGRFAWLLEDVHPVDPWVPAKGSLGLWEWNGAAK